MNWEIISNLIVIMGLFAVVFLDYRINRKTQAQLIALEQEFNDALQIIKDKVDADAEINDARYSGFHQNLGTVDLKLTALGHVSGFVLENGLWQKQKPVAGKATPAKKPTTATKKTTRGGK